MTKSNANRALENLISTGRLLIRLKAWVERKKGTGGSE